MKVNKTFFPAWMIILITHVMLAQQSSMAQSVSLEIFAQKMKQSSDPQIIDVRTPEEFAENHLKGAINISLNDDILFQKSIAALDKRKATFVYSINNGRSGKVVNKLREHGFVEVYELPGGLAAWIGSGKPVESILDKGISMAYYKTLLASSNVVLVNVGSKYCGGCKKLIPVIDEIVAEQRDSLKVIRIELYDNRELAQVLEIESVPTLILYKNGNPIWRQSGKISKAEIQNALENSTTQRVGAVNENLNKWKVQDTNDASVLTFSSSCEGASSVMKARRMKSESIRDRK